MNAVYKLPLRDVDNSLAFIGREEGHTISEIGEPADNGYFDCFHISEPGYFNKGKGTQHTFLADTLLMLLFHGIQVTMDDTLAPMTSFFDVGGDSLMAAELLGLLKAKLPSIVLPHLSIRALIANPSAIGLATHLLAHVEPGSVGSPAKSEFQLTQVTSSQGCSAQHFCSLRMLSLQGLDIFLTRVAWKGDGTCRQSCISPRCRHTQNMNFEFTSC